MMRCPSCQHPIVSDSIFRRSMHCPACNAKLMVSETYSRILVLISLFIAWGLLWVLNVRSFFYALLCVPLGFSASLWLGFPMAFLVLWVLVRTLPRVVIPKIVLRHSGTITTLDLHADAETYLRCAIVDGAI